MGYSTICLLAWVGFALFSATLPEPADAVRASPWPIEHVQPDNTSVTLFLRGDENFNWYEDEKGFSVVSKPSFKPGTPEMMVYAAISPVTGDFVPTPLEVGKVNPAAFGLVQNQLPGLSGLLQNAHPTNFGTGPVRRRREVTRRQTALLGNVQNLVVMVRFADHKTRPLPSKENLGILFNNVGPNPLCPTGSVRDVWYLNSYGSLTIQSVLTGWIDVAMTEKTAANGVSGDQTLHVALKEALGKAYNLVDFSPFDQNKDGYIDMVTFVHSGYGAEWGGTDSFGATKENRIWSHMWQLSSTFTNAKNVKVSVYHISPALWATSGSEMGRIGVIAHETGHFLGLPDLYDTDYSGSGIGSWGLMSNSWGFDGGQRNPPHLSAWSKIFLKYITPTVISQSGVYTAAPSATTREIYKIAAGFPAGEYLLIENRQPVGFETILANSRVNAAGLIIWHIDDKAGYYGEGYPGQSGWPTNGRHYRVSVLQADGLYGLERNADSGNSGDPWRVGGNTVLSPTSTPNTNTYQGGIVKSTGITITVLSPSNNTMSFRVELPGSTPTTTTCGTQSITCAAGTVLQGSKSCVTGSTCNVATCCAAFCSVNAVGTACNDNNALTVNDKCIAGGTCVGTPPSTCSLQSVSCTVSGTVRVDNRVCVPNSNCTSTACCATFCSINPVGTPCNDNLSTTFNDKCTAARTCVGTVGSTCAQNVACTVPGTVRADNRMCVPNVNCTSTACCGTFCSINPVGTACNDNNAATVGDKCVAGALCMGTPATCASQLITCSGTDVLQTSKLCTPGSTCTTAACCLPFCSGKPVGTACNDNNPLTAGDTCLASGVCAGTALSTCLKQSVVCVDDDVRADDQQCTPGVDCNVASCCSPFCAVNAEGTSCDDNNSRTTDDNCQSGVCVGTPIGTGGSDLCADHMEIECDPTRTLSGDYTCTPGVDCDADTCCVPICEVADPGTSCDDGNDLSTNDVCNDQNTCVGTFTCGTYAVECEGTDVLDEELSCVADEDCTTEHCCVPFCAWFETGTPCDDSNASTFKDQCTDTSECKGTQATCENQKVVCTAAAGRIQKNINCIPGKTCNVATCCAGNIKVAMTVKRVLNANSRWVYRASVTLYDKTSNVVLKSAKIIGTLTGAGGWSEANRSVVTSNTGLGVITSSKTWARSSALDRTVKFCVTSVVKTGYVLGAAVCATVTP